MIPQFWKFDDFQAADRIQALQKPYRSFTDGVKKAFSGNVDFYLMKSLMFFY
jgi:hypothetical protein